MAVGGITARILRVIRRSPESSTLSSIAGTRGSSESVSNQPPRASRSIATPSTLYGLRRPSLPRSRVQRAPPLLALGSSKPTTEPNTGPSAIASGASSAAARNTLRPSGSRATSVNPSPTPSSVPSSKSCSASTRGSPPCSTGSGKSTLAFGVEPVDRLKSRSRSPATIAPSMLGRSPDASAF